MLLPVTEIVLQIVTLGLQRVERFDLDPRLLGEP